MRGRLTMLVAAAVLTAAAPAAAQQVTIYRDAHGIPHIEAGSRTALAYGTGYALANDRPFLTAGIRLAAQGRTSELLGESALPADIVTRRDFYDAADVRRQYDGLPADVKAELRAFSDGFNRGLREVMLDPLRRPAAFDLLGYYPEPWQPTDSVSVVMLFSYVEFAGEGGAGQLRNAELLAHLEGRFGRRRGLRMWDDLLLKNDPRAPTVGGPGTGGRAPRSIRRERPGRNQLRVARLYGGVLGQAAEARSREATLLKRILRRIPLPKIGSYAAVLGGRRTASGGALLVGSPQAGLSAPPVFWQLGQHAPGVDCTGFTVPGLGPWTGIGWCSGHAWSLVAGNIGEQVDNYVERVDPRDPRRYRYRGGWRRMTVRRESFRANKCLPPICSEPSTPRTETVELDYTVHGPVVARDRARGIAITQRRAQRGVWARSIRSVVGWNRARGLRAFEAETDRATGSYNLLYGDAEGNALYRFTGLQPVRAPGVDRRLPSPGAGGAEWRGFLPQARMPRVLNPPRGLVASNQGIETKPVPWWPNSSDIAVGQVSRVAGNRRILAGAGRLDADGLERVNPLLLERRDVITPIFARQIERALAASREEPRLREALQLFREWRAAGYPRVDANGDGLYDHPAIAIFGADNFDLDFPRPLWDGLLERVFADELGTRVEDGRPRPVGVPGTWLGKLSLLKLALDGRRASRRLSHRWVDDVHTAHREIASGEIRASLRAALDKLSREFGTTRMRAWLRPVPTQHFAPLGVVGPPAIRGFDHGTYSQIVDPRARNGRYILPPGNQAADAGPQIAAAELGSYPEHFTDQLAMYERYDFLPMLHRRDQYRSAPESVTSFQYGGP